MKKEKVIGLVFAVLFFYIVVIIFNLNFVSAECNPSWDCTFGECINNLATKTCVDLHNCGNDSTKPNMDGQTEACTIQPPKDCIDKDYDGYGKGKDCFGKDLDDNNPLINKGKEKELHKKTLIIIIVLIIISGIFFILSAEKLVKIKKENKNKLKIAFFLIFLVSFSFLVYAQSIAPPIDVDSGPEYGYYSAIALDTNGKVHIVHQKMTSPFEIRYCNNLDGDFSDGCEQIVAEQGSTLSLALGLDDSPYISYSGGGKLKFCYRKVSGSWNCEQIGTENYVGYHSSIAVDKNNGLHISYYKDNSGRPAYCTNKSGSWNCFELQDGFAGIYIPTSLAIDKDNNVHISYATKTKLIYCYNPISTNLNCEEISSLTSSTTPQYNSIAVDSNKKAHISYWSAAVSPNSKLNYATNADGSWKKTEGISNDGSFNSIVIDKNNRAHIIFYSSSQTAVRYCSNNNINRFFQCENLAASVGNHRGTGSLSDRNAAIKKGRLCDSTSFSDDVHTTWTYVSGGTQTVKYTRYVDYAKDWTPPLITIIKPVSSPDYTSNPIPFEITTDEDVQLCEYKIDAETTRTAMIIDGTKRKATASRAVANGDHNIQFWCRDMASPYNEGTTSGSFSMTIANNPPSQPASVLLTPTIANPSTTFTCTASGSTDGDVADSIFYYYEFWRTRGASTTSLQAYSTTESYLCSPSNCQVGDIIKCKAKAFDSKDFSIEKESNSVTITAADTTPPVLTIVSPADSNPAGTINLRITSNELLSMGVGDCTYSTAGQSGNMNVDTPGQLGASNSIVINTPSPSGTPYNVIFNCKDLAGNLGTISKPYAVTAVTAPTITCIATSDTSFWRDSNGNDVNSLLDCRRNGNTPSTCCPSNLPYCINNGINNICVANPNVDECGDYTNEADCIGDATSNHIAIADVEANILIPGGFSPGACTDASKACKGSSGCTDCVKTGSCKCTWDSTWNSGLGKCLAYVEINPAPAGCGPGPSGCTKLNTIVTDCIDGERNIDMFFRWESSTPPTLPAPAWCIDKKLTLECLPETAISFFGIWNFVAVILIIIAVYLIMKKKKKYNNKKKAKKRV